MPVDLRLMGVRMASLQPVTNGSEGVKKARMKDRKIWLTNAKVLYGTANHSIQKTQ